MLHRYEGTHTYLLQRIRTSYVVVQKQKSKRTVSDNTRNPQLVWYIHLYIYKYHQLPEKKKISINGLVIGLKFGKRTARKFRKKNENRTKSTIFLKINKKSEKLTCPLKLMESTNHLGNFLSEQSTKIAIRMSHRLRPPVLYCEQHGPPENLKKKKKKNESQ